MTRFRKTSAAICAAAAISMAATPAMAAEIPVNTAPKISVPGAVQWDADVENAERSRRHRYRHRRGRVDAGDVLAGVLIIGGIAAIASAASSNKRARSYPAQQTNYRNSQRDTRSTNGQGIDRAVDMCLREIERDVRVDNVDAVNRSGEGWNVTGSLYNGDSFSCHIGNNGRVENVFFGGRVSASVPSSQDNQWGDERYRQARLTADDVPQTAMVDIQPTGPQPAYPGGPIDGDLDRDGDFGG